MKQWSLTLLLVIVTFIVAGVIGSLLAEFMGIWREPTSGFLAAICVVLVSCIAAPKHKFATAIFTFLTGTALATYLLRSSHYPESHTELAYQPTIIPLAVTIAGGVIGVIICRAITFTTKPKRNNPKLKQDPH